MKKSILTLTAILICFASMAQTNGPAKKDSVTAKKAQPKPEFNFDQNKLRTFNITLSASNASLLTWSKEQWEDFENSPQYSGKDIQQTKQRAAIIRSMVMAKIDSIAGMEFKKFQADTAITNHKTKK